MTALRSNDGSAGDVIMARLRHLQPLPQARPHRGGGVAALSSALFICPVSPPQNQVRVAPENGVAKEKARSSRAKSAARG
jgi:hypothetical protein